MLSTRKTLKSRSLQSSTSRSILLGDSGTGRCSSSYLLFHRDFSWGSQHKGTTSRAEKTCKDSSTQGLSGKYMTQKQFHRSLFWGNHHLRRSLPRYAPVQEWRSSSSWGNKPETPSGSRKDHEENEEEDWYSRWERQRLKQYNDFIKKVERDPYTALFGRSWLNFGGEDTEPRAARNSTPDPPKGSPLQQDERSRGNWATTPKSNNAKLSEDRQIPEKPPKSGTIAIQEHDQEYKIDPITNRKVFKASASSVSTFSHAQPQVKDGERAIETFSKRWNTVSPTPLDHRFIVVEHEQVVPEPNPPGKGTPPVKPQNNKDWLAQEGFGASQESTADPQPALQTHNAKPNTTITKIESALDRHLNSKSTSDKEKSDGPKLQYKTKDNQTEDLDLLRPSDVRASAGLRGNPPKETDDDKQARRKKLEEKYESSSPDHAEAASNKLVQKGEDLPVRIDKATELRFGSWLKGTLQDAELRPKEALKGTPAPWKHKSLDEKDFDPRSIHQTSDSLQLSKNKIGPERSPAIAPETSAKVRDKADKLKAQIVPFKAKLDAMRADYDFLRQEWLQEIRILKEKAAKKEEETKARKVAQRAREIHEEEVKAQKVAMEAMEMRSSDRTTNATKTNVAGGLGRDCAEHPAPRRLQSFIQGEGDMASNVHEFAGRDRWYKRKAPHAMDAKDVENDARLQRAARDRALIREIRSIYEDTYGTIDTKHRQLDNLPPLVGDSGQRVTPSSGKVDPDAQLPSSATGIAESSKSLDKSRISDALAIIQKLFGQLREAQSIIIDSQIQTKLNLDPHTTDTNIFRTPVAFEKNILQLLRIYLQLARVRRGGMIPRDVVEAACVKSEKATVLHPPSTIAPKHNYHEVQKAPELNTYCILAYDSATESVRTFETLVPFSKEESLLPLDALNRVSNPAKFLAHAISLGAKGYEPVSGTTNILVFKKTVTPQDLAAVKETGAGKESNPIRDSHDHLRDVSSDSFDSKWPFDLTSKEDVNELRGTKAEQHKVTEAQKHAAEKIEKEDQKVEIPSQTVTDSIPNQKQPFKETQTEQLASSVSPSHTSSDRVHRQETVFSGSRQGRWVDHSVKYRRSKRAADRRRKTMKRMLMTGAFTAACCYCVGVASELMHG